jgi:hypothetical protein
MKRVCVLVMFINWWLANSLTKLGQVMLVALLSVSAANAATVSYDAPNISIKATGEPLTGVLRSVAEATGISVSIREDINPAVYSDIQVMALPKALERILRGLSYSFVWQPGGKELSGVLVMGSDGKTDKVMKSIVSGSVKNAVSGMPSNKMSIPNVGQMDRNSSDPSPMDIGGQEMEARELEMRELEEQEHRQHDEEMRRQERESRRLVEQRVQEFSSEMEVNTIELERAM